MGSLMHRAQDRAPVVRSKGREKEHPEAKPLGFFIRGRFCSFPDRPRSLPTVCLLIGLEAVT